MMADRLILRGAKGYEEARVARIFNARRPERPAAVLQAESEFDIVEGVGLARDRGWKVAIRSGGHSIPAWSLRDDALLIDLGGFKETSLDTTTGVASVTTSVTGGSVEVDLQQVFMSGSPHTVGEVSAVGRRCGLTKLLSVSLSTAGSTWFLGTREGLRGPSRGRRRNACSRRTAPWRCMGHR
jgi:FAD binding domain